MGLPEDIAEECHGYKPFEFINSTQTQSQASSKQYMYNQ